MPPRRTGRSNPDSQDPLEPNTGTPVIIAPSDLAPSDHAPSDHAPSDHAPDDLAQDLEIPSASVPRATPFEDQTTANLAQAITLMTEELRRCDKPATKAKAKEPDVFDGSDPKKDRKSVV